VLEKALFAAGSSEQLNAILYYKSIIIIIIIIIIIKLLLKRRRLEIKVTLKTIKPLQGHFTKVIKIELKWRCSRMKV